MQHPHQFVESLLEVRVHYQSLHDEYERSCIHIREQMSHVNALLIEQLSNQQFVESLMELRAYYQALYEEQQQKVAHAREQLSHLNALLADSLVLQHNGQHSVSIQSATVEREPQALAATTDAQHQEESSPEESEPPNSLNSPLSSPASQTEQLQEDEPTQLPPVKTPLLPQYANLTKLQAVEKLLREYSGGIVDTNYIIYALHGKLEPEDIKEEKPRMYDTLKKGVEKGLWERVPNSPGCYTLDLKLLESEAKKKEAEDNKRQGRKSRYKSRDEMLPRYQNLSFTDAVEAVLREKAGQTLTTDKVAKELYGELKGYALTKAKEKIGKTLWSGASQGRWQRVPGKLGSYTLDLKLVSQR